MPLIVSFSVLRLLALHVRLRPVPLAANDNTQKRLPLKLGSRYSNGRCVTQNTMQMSMSVTIANGCIINLLNERVIQPWRIKVGLTDESRK